MVSIRRNIVKRKGGRRTCGGAFSLAQTIQNVQKGIDELPRNAFMKGIVNPIKRWIKKQKETRGGEFPPLSMLPRDNLLLNDEVFTRKYRGINPKWKEEDRKNQEEFIKKVLARQRKLHNPGMRGGKISAKSFFRFLLNPWAGVVSAIDEKKKKKEEKKMIKEMQKAGLVNNPEILGEMIKAENAQNDENVDISEIEALLNSVPQVQETKQEPINPEVAARLRRERRGL